ncbi:MAG: hypothetical protein WB799_23550, partial [Candidatus Sulfotelmatobacter sp.]
TAMCPMNLKVRPGSKHQADIQNCYGAKTMEQRTVEQVEIEVAMTAAVEAVNRQWKKDVFVMHGGAKIPCSVEEFGLTAFGETLDRETARALYNEVLEIVFVLRNPCPVSRSS